MPNLGTSEILIIALVILLLFGGAKIPSLMKGLGQGIREFRREVRGDDPAKDPKAEPPKDRP